MKPPRDDRVCTKCVLNSTFPGITFDSEGVCSVCRRYEMKYASMEAARRQLPERRAVLERLCEDARRKRRTFDVLVPLSGGKDSMYVLYLAVKELGLKPLAFTLDNGYLTDHARKNIDRACGILGVEHVYYCMDPHLMKKLYRLFIEKTGYFCSLCMRAIGMATEITAQMYDIPLVFGGTAAKVELPLAPEMFQSGPPDFVANVLRGEPLEKEAKRLTYGGSIKRWLGYRLFWWGSQRRVRICAWLNLPDYMEWDYTTMFSTIRDELGWSSPSGEDEEHIDCGIHKVSAYIHDRRWKGSDIRRLTFAGLIMAGQLSREEALHRLTNEPPPQYSDADLEPFLHDIGMSRPEFDKYIDMGPRYINFRPQPGMAWNFIRQAKHTVFRLLRLRR